MLSRSTTLYETKKRTMFKFPNCQKKILEQKNQKFYPDELFILAWLLVGPWSLGWSKILLFPDVIEEHNTIWCQKGEPCLKMQKNTCILFVVVEFLYLCAFFLSWIGLAWKTWPQRIVIPTFLHGVKITKLQ